MYRMLEMFSFNSASGQATNLKIFAKWKFLLLGIVFFGCIDTKKSNEKSTESKIVNQEKENRTVTSIVEKLNTVNISEQYEIFRPYLLEKNNLGDVYLFSTNPDHLKFFVFDKNFEQKNSFGGFGQGPGEYINPIDIEISHSKNQVIIMDSGNYKVDFWDYEGNLQKSKPLSITPYRFELLGKDKFIVHSPGDLEYFVSLTDSNFSLEKSIIDDDENQTVQQKFFSSAGDIVVDKKSKEVFYAGTGNSLIAKYNIEGVPVFKRNSIEPIEKTQTVQTKEGVSKRDPNSSFAARRIKLYQNYAIVLYVGKSEKAHKWLDFYNKENGDYLFSHAFDRFTTDITFIDSSGKFYSLSSSPQDDWFLSEFQIKN